MIEILLLIMAIAGVGTSLQIYDDHADRSVARESIRRELQRRDVDQLGSNQCDRNAPSDVDHNLSGHPVRDARNKR